MCEAGADILEIGLPFSDPIADGPTIQASHYRALQTQKIQQLKKGLNVLGELKVSIVNLLYLWDLLT